MNNNRFKILILEDENNPGALARLFSEMNNYHVISASDFTQGLMLFSSYIPDLILIDLNVSEKKYFAFIGEVRKNYITPILVLSDRVQESSVVDMLEAGANDYIRKPYGKNELVARVKVALREKSMMTEIELPVGGRFVLKDLVIDYDKRQITVGGNLIRLTQTEYNILSLLSKHADKVMTYEEILHAIWGGADVGSVKKLQVNMVNIRKKIGENPAKAKYIINLPGVGYRMIESE
ncbi:MAG: response regulator transcription factor [Lachnospiraceae bacterium]|nr:response regulator transcription factor [Lachnospiraceae bacterium]